MQSRRVEQWNNFSWLVAHHIENYTVKQYGDLPDDPMSAYSEEVLIEHIKRYVNRLETSARGPEESQRDLLKLAHYAAVLYDKREEQPKEKLSLAEIRERRRSKNGIPQK